MEGIRTVGRARGQKRPKKSENLKVVVRVRPLMQREALNGSFISTTAVAHDTKTVQLYEYFNIEIVPPEDIEEFIQDPDNFQAHTFTFDRVFDESTSQECIYEDTARLSVANCLEGYNATILAYGQTGTGKTYTMEGFSYDGTDPVRGIIPRSIEEIFSHIQNQADELSTFMVRCSYLQIYNENVSDLLKPERGTLQIRERAGQGVFVDNLSEWAVRSPNEIYSLLKKGAYSRATAATNMNDVSSRSHAVFIVTLEQKTGKGTKVSKLNLVDLAGSERIGITGAKGQRLEECKKINQSLSALGHVIAALTDKKLKRSHIPYRDSKLTRLLEDSLGGNCKTTFMAMISPAVDAFNESISTLRFANSAKSIRNKPIINKDEDQRALLHRYESELRNLRTQLETRNKNLVDHGKLFQLEEEKRRAERDKEAAFAALEERSKDFFKEREQKRSLEQQIQNMKSQLISGGALGFNDPPNSKRESLIAKKTYEKKISELENERTKLEETQAQVDRYRGLLQKQRDIMIALATRLNERDESIAQLQEELEAYDKIHKDSESQKHSLKNRILLLESYIQQQGMDLPAKQLEQSPESEEVDKKEGVTLDDVETFNITYNNLLNSEQKIQELALIADQRKHQIDELTQVLQSISTPGSEASLQLQEVIQENNQLKQETESYKMEIKSLTNKNVSESTGKYLRFL